MIHTLLSIAVIVSAAIGQTPSELVRGLVAAINTKDRRAIETFLKSNADSSVPVAERAERFFGFAEQGAPFRIEGEPKVEPGRVIATLVDREGVTVELTLTTTGKPPKLASVRAVPLRRNDPALADWKDLRALALEIMGRAKTPGVALGLDRAGKLDGAVVGVREIAKPEELRIDDPLSIGSIGKPICSTIIGKLIEQGKLRWDQTLKESFPDIAMQTEYAKATLEQVMRHRGGLPGDLGFTQADVDRIVSKETDPVKIRRNYAQDVLARPALGKPGETHQYSNAGYSLLGHLAETVTGKPYEQLVREMVFAPLGLKNSYVGNATLPKGHPVGHLETPDGLKPFLYEGPLEVIVAPAGGGHWMSIGDLVRFGRMHLDGLNGKDGLLKAATVKRLHEGLPEPGGEMRYACGWGIESFPGIETFHGHNGSNGTMHAQLCLFPKANLVVAAIVTSGGEKGMPPSLQATLAVAGRYAKR